jgi:hypothetical protein
MRCRATRKGRGWGRTKYDEHLDHRSGGMPSRIASLFRKKAKPQGSCSNKGSLVLDVHLGGFGPTPSLPGVRPVLDHGTRALFCRGCLPRPPSEEGIFIGSHVVSSRPCLLYREFLLGFKSQLLDVGRFQHRRNHQRHGVCLAKVSSRRNEGSRIPLYPGDHRHGIRLFPNIGRHIPGVSRPGHGFHRVNELLFFGHLCCQGSVFEEAVCEQAGWPAYVLSWPIPSRFFSRPGIGASNLSP